MESSALVGNLTPAVLLAPSAHLLD